MGMRMQGYKKVQKQCFSAPTTSKYDQQGREGLSAREHKCERHKHQQEGAKTIVFFP